MHSDIDIFDDLVLGIQDLFVDAVYIIPYVQVELMDRSAYKRYTLIS